MNDKNDIMGSPFNYESSNNFNFGSLNDVERMGLLNFSDSITADQDKYDWRGCKAKLNVERIKKNWGSNPDYRLFINNNHDTEFTLKLRKEVPDNDIEMLDKQLINGVYTFEENDRWDIHCTNLIITKNGKEFKC